MIDEASQQIRSLHTSCIHPCSTKSDCCRRFAGIWTDSPSAAASRLLSKCSRPSSRGWLQSWSGRSSASFKRRLRMCSATPGRKRVGKRSARGERSDRTGRDDGKGITQPVADLRPDKIGVGIGGMSQRAKEFGGELRMMNAHPGTVVEVVIPCHAPALQESGAPA